MLGSQKCCGELVELTVDDIWQIADATHLSNVTHISAQCHTLYIHNVQKVS